MANLPENTSYTGRTNKMFTAAFNALKGSPMQRRRKKYRESPTKYQGLVNRVNNATSTGVLNTSSGLSSPAQRPRYNLTSPLGVITTKYGDTTRYEKFHPALDIANKIGTPIPSFTPGKVTEVVTGRRQGDKGYGNYVIVTDPQGNRHRYSHLHRSYVKVGDVINPKDVLGEMGNTGSTYSNTGGTGSHLDYRIMDAYGRYVNPSKYFSNKT